jgi:hypothetical protein
MKFAQSLQVAIKVSAVATVFAFSAVVSTAHAADSLSATGIQKTQLEKLQFGNVAESTVNTGAFEVKLASAPTTPFWVYCLDPLEGFNNSTNATTSMSLFTYLNGGQYAGQFSGSNYANAVAGGYQAQNTNTVLTKLVDLYSHAYNDSLMNSTKSAAFQYAVWEVIGGTDYSGTSSNSLRYGANHLSRPAPGLGRHGQHRVDAAVRRAQFAEALFVVALQFIRQIEVARPGPQAVEQGLAGFVGQAQRLQRGGQRHLQQQVQARQEPIVNSSWGCATPCALASNSSRRPRASASSCSAAEAWRPLAADISITDSQRPTSARPSSMTALSTVSTAREAPMAGLLA